MEANSVADSALVSAAPLVSAAEHANIVCLLVITIRALLSPNLINPPWLRAEPFEALTRLQSQTLS